MRRVGSIDPHHDGLVAEVGRAQGLDHAGTRGILLVRRDGVLEVQEDLVGLETDGLGDEALVGSRHGVAGAA